MSALPAKLQPFDNLPPQIREVLALGLSEYLEAPGELAGLCQAPPEPMPWPGVLHEVFTAPPNGEAARFGPDPPKPNGYAVGPTERRFGPDHPFCAAALIGFAVRQIEQSKGRLTVWIGRRVWPYPLVLDRAGLLGGSLFVDAKDNNQRLWAAELSLRCAAVASVIADGSGFSMSATRRLQLISRESEALMLLARPSCDERQLSAAGARWRVAPAPPDGEEQSPQWSIELLRCKGVRPALVNRHGQSHSCWRLLWDAEQACARSARGAEIPGGLPADVAGGPAATADRAPRRAG